MTNEIFEMDAGTFCIYTEDWTLTKALRQNPKTTYFGSCELHGKWHAEFFLFAVDDLDGIAKQAGPFIQQTAKQQE